VRISIPLFSSQCKESTRTQEYSTFAFRIVASLRLLQGCLGACGDPPVHTEVLEQIKVPMRTALGVRAKSGALGNGPESVSKTFHSMGRPQLTMCDVSRHVFRNPELSVISLSTGFLTTSAGKTDIGVGDRPNSSPHRGVQDTHPGPAQVRVSSEHSSPATGAVTKTTPAAASNPTPPATSAAHVELRPSPATAAPGLADADPSTQSREAVVPAWTERAFKKDYNEAILTDM